MEKQKQESKQTSTEGDTFYRWIPYAVAGVIFVFHLIAAMMRENIWILFGGQLLALAVFFIVRMAFPRPEAVFTK
jgi:hypothetical protein